MSKGGWRGVAVALVAFLAYLPALGCFFHSDDFFVLHGVVRGGPFGVWSGTDGGFFRPLGSLSVWLDSTLWGLRPVGYHLTSVLLHAANGALVAGLAARLFERYGAPERVRRLGPWLAGLLFALLPAHAEAVVWISSRTDLLATFFGLLALILALSEGRVAWLAPLPFALAMLSKESALMLPFFLGLLLLLARPRGESARRAVLLGGALLMTAVLVVAFRAWRVGGWIGGYGPSTHLGDPRGLVGNVGLYFGKALMPVSLQGLALAPPTAGATEWALANMRWVAALGALLFLLALGWFIRRRSRLDPAGQRLAAALFLGFFVLALPALPLGMSRYTMEGTRFLYLPTVALCVLLAAGIASLGRTAGRVTAALTLGIYGVGIYLAQGPWLVAGEAARKALGALASAPEGRVVLLSVPDSYRGAYCLRNGLKEAIDLYLPRKRLEAVQVTSYMWEAPGAVPTLQRRGAQGEVIAPGGPFLPFQRTPGGEERAAGAGVRLLHFAPFRMVFEDPRRGARVLTPEGWLGLPGRAENLPP